MPSPIKTPTPHPDGKKPRFAFDTPCHVPFAASAGEGWRFLEHGERIEYGDMTATTEGSFKKSVWIPCVASVGRIVSATQQFRRKISEHSNPPTDDELTQLRSSLAASQERVRELETGLTTLKAACIDVLLPSINEAIAGGFKISTWTPEQMQWSKAVEVTDGALLKSNPAKA